MWNIIDDRLLNSLSRPVDRNGKHPGAPSVVASMDSADVWDSRIAELKTYAAYENDWDGQGTAAIPIEVSASAIALANALRLREVPPPASVVPGVNGTMSMEWELGRGKSIEVEVMGPDVAEVFVYSMN